MRYTAAMLCFARIFAQDAFKPPQPYPPERYTLGWTKNPFCLKTAPEVAPKDSFAKDLVLVSMYRIRDDTVVILANTKTLQRVKLKNDEPAPDGMKVKAAFIKDTRKESCAEVVLGDETAVLHYDHPFLKQMAAQRATQKLLQPLINGPANTVAMNNGMPSASPITGASDNLPPSGSSAEQPATASNVPTGRRVRLIAGPKP
jgi:hypothetical protein